MMGNHLWITQVQDHPLSVIESRLRRTTPDPAEVLQWRTCCFLELFWITVRRIVNSFSLWWSFWSLFTKSLIILLSWTWTVLCSVDNQQNPVQNRTGKQCWFSVISFFLLHRALFCAPLQLVSHHLLLHLPVSRRQTVRHLFLVWECEIKSSGVPKGVTSFHLIWRHENTTGRRALINNKQPEKNTHRRKTNRYCVYIREASSRSTTMSFYSLLLFLWTVVDHHRMWNWVRRVDVFLFRCLPLSGGEWAASRDQGLVTPPPSRKPGRHFSGSVFLF